MLNERSQQILGAVVRSYIEKAEPVGSRFLTKRYAFNLSPATIRNIMADLEEMGFLAQPHTSAGRVPTDKGYRFFVDSLRTEDCLLDDAFVAALKLRLDALKSDVNHLLEEATRAVSELSHSLAFAIPMRAEGTTINRIQLYRYRNRQTVAVIFTAEGLVTTKVVDTDFGLTQRELDRISDFLNSEFYGRTIDEMRAELKRQISKQRRRCDILIAKAEEICREALHFSGNDLIVAGISEILGLPELSDRINDIADAIENKHRIVRLLDRLAETEGVRVIIGSENPDLAMRDISIITADYRQGDRPLGRVGIIGPTRMDYSRTIPLVEVMARFISASLER